jgi:hypothetical protein
LSRWPEITGSSGSCTESDNLVQALVQASEGGSVSACPSDGCDSPPARSGRRGRWFKSSRPDL